MELIPLIIAAFLAIAVFVYVTAPLWRRTISVVQLPADTPGDVNLVELSHERDVTLKTLRDLDFDYKLGKLSDEDYQGLRARYAAQGVAILQQMDAAAGLGDADLADQIEAEVRRRRSIGGRPVRTGDEVRELAAEAVPASVMDNGVLEEIEAEVRRRRAARPAAAATSPGARPTQPGKLGPRPAARAGARCSECDEPYQPGDRFCARCGATLTRTCPACGAAASSDARFCAACGTKLEK